MGRVVHPDFLGGEPPVSASATTAPLQAHTYAGKKPYVQARPLRIDEVPGLLEDYRKAARNALEAGFDGVQIHAANGYLIDQFLRDNSNLRTDEYGGPMANRIRLLREVTQAVADTVGPDRTGVRLSPNDERQGVDDSNPQALFPAAAAALSEVGIAYLELREPGPDGTNGKAAHPAIAPAMKAVFSGKLVLNADYVGATARQAIESGAADAIAFGRTFLANPDLPRRLAENLPLNKDHQPTWYSQGPEGYIDYPFYESQLATA